MGTTGGPETRAPGQFTATNMTLRLLLAEAYHLKPYQIAGPPWIDSQRYNILAKLPSDTTNPQFGVMLQNLLAERFKLKVHREKKELPVYSLVVGKNGPKLKQAAPAPADSEDAPPLPPPGPPKIGKDGLPELPSGIRGPMILVMPGRVRMRASSITISEFVGVLENQVARPVIDETGLSGNYEIALDYSPDETGRAMPGMPGLPPPPPPGGAGGMPSPAAGPAGALPSDMSEGVPTLFAAIQQLGLKLEARKAPVDLLVVDSGDKTPIEN